ncbi:type II toxin-antitoxin system VapC family toxin [Allofranklinella schreckenbergeri]|uniref:Type II toxin-antitoxin system VapC family toxin n=1 Tax=Allofranklinella schreckenbergeri TaxID=1076744 RepID=A0A3M6QX20_9BURK|nr:type II toxin-antitoxin system VapC family toxin [Allofranklinella schreckenbergeri]RMX07533.1 type II toxin-antitoxin system VapC family toxin [Allofranklinella schreckenbergeri]RRD42777.1 PIN domain-containing protein [Comamonadaceae bacterium OH3737_COT-264]
MYLLDSNVLAELRPGKPKPSPQVRQWAATVAQSLFYLSAITILEQEEGVLRVERRDPAAGQALRRWATAVHQAFAGRILPFGEREALLCAPMHVPDPKARRDSMIAATALAHGMTLVTRNIQDFERTGVRLLNPWAGEI